MSKFRYIKENKAVFAVYVVLRLIVLACLVLSAVDGNWENVFVCLLVLVLFLVPNFLQRKLSVEFPSALQIIILLFIFAAEILSHAAAFLSLFRCCLRPIMKTAAWSVSASLSLFAGSIPIRRPSCIILCSLWIPLHDIK